MMNFEYIASKKRGQIMKSNVTATNWLCLRVPVHKGTKH